MVCTSKAGSLGHHAHFPWYTFFGLQKSVLTIKGPLGQSFLFLYGAMGPIKGCCEDSFLGMPWPFEDHSEWTTNIIYKKDFSLEVRRAKPGDAPDDLSVRQRD